MRNTKPPKTSANLIKIQLVFLVGMAGICTLNVRVFAEFIDGRGCHRATQCKLCAACRTARFDNTSATADSDLSCKHKAQPRNKGSLSKTPDIFADVLAFSTVFQRVQRDRAVDDHAFRVTPCVCNCYHGCAGRCHRRHSGRRRHYCVECSGVADHCRHSGLRRCHCRHSGLMRTKNPPFRALMYNVNTSKIERGNTH